MALMTNFILLRSGDSAHKISAVKNCDNIFHMEKSVLKELEKFDTLIKENI